MKHPAPLRTWLAAIICRSPTAPEPPMSLIRVLCYAAPVVAIALPVLAETTILPGYWESKNHSELLVTQDSTDRKCITPAQVETYLSGPANNHYTSTYDHRAVGDGAVNLARH